MTTTFSLEQYADALLGDHTPQNLQWLTRRLRGESKPQLPGYKAGRQWRATAADIETAIDLLRPKPVAIPDIPISSMTRTSRRRIAS